MKIAFSLLGIEIFSWSAELTPKHTPAVTVNNEISGGSSHNFERLEESTEYVDDRFGFHR